MLKLFQERCCFCSHEEAVSESDYFYGGETEEDEDGDTFLVPTFISSKVLAKKWFKLKKWRYYNNLVFCEDCYSTLKNGYVVMDKFNHFYDNEGCHTSPIHTSCVLSEQEAIEFSQYQYNNEIVTYYRALRKVSKFLNRELKCDVLGYMNANPEATVISEITSRGF